MHPAIRKAQPHPFFQAQELKGVKGFLFLFSLGLSLTSILPFPTVTIAALLSDLSNP